MPFKVIQFQSHRFCYQSKAHVRLLLVTNLPPVLHHFQVMADYYR